MPDEKKTAAELRAIANDTLKCRCYEDFHRLFDETLLPAAKNREFSVTISSEEMKELRSWAYRATLFSILEEKKFKVEETHDRDDVFIQISWREKE